MGKITHNRIAGSSKSSAMMKREASSFSCLLGNLASHKKSGNEITSYGKRRRQTKGSYMKYEALKFDEESEEQCISSISRSVRKLCRTLQGVVS